ncbi:MAG: hypothetical protein M1546_21870 [Chloroflexi bacterium]|nr:hypothetical protein [Chloroflexota bacterium]
MRQMLSRKWIQHQYAAMIRILATAEEKRATVWSDLNERLEHGVDLHSRRGVEGAIWTILSVSLVAVIAVTVLFTLGPKLIQLGQNAVSKVQSPPW